MKSQLHQVFFLLLFGFEDGKFCKVSRLNLWLLIQGLQTFFVVSLKDLRYVLVVLFAFFYQLQLTFC
jgi:hypothetical protein